MVTLAGVVLVLAATGASWGTLCIGDDGHVAFEAAAAGDCVGGAARGASGAGVAPSDAVKGAPPCCGPCTDLARVGADWLTGSAPDPDPGPVAGAPVLAPWAPRAPAHLPRRHRRDAPDAAAAGATALRALASTVIRC